jgi:hypothetical protein
MYQYQLSFKTMAPAKRDLLMSLVNSVKGTLKPFWFADPYDYVNSAETVGSGITTGSAFITDQFGYYIRPYSTQVATLFSSLSGYVSNGNEYSYNVDSGMISITTKNTSDIWGVRSLTILLHKCSFDRDYSDVSRLWEIWNANISFTEQL